MDDSSAISGRLVVVGALLLGIGVGVATAVVTVVVRGEGILDALLLGGPVRTPIRRAIVAGALIVGGSALLDLVLVGGRVIARKLEVAVRRHA